jgi:hypothetical protein
MSEPKPNPVTPKATSDDILAAVYSLIAVVQALEEWHHADRPIAFEPESEAGDEEAQVA